MSASSSAASSSLSRSRTVILLLTSFAAAYLIYCHHTASRAGTERPDPTITGPGLHRSNAIRPRRRTRIDDENAAVAQRRDLEESEGDADSDEMIVRPLGDGETVVDEHDPENWNWDEPPPRHRAGQNMLQLLFRVSEDATRRNACAHRGCQCNSCGMLPIRGVRYRCSNCYDFDLCEACEAQGLHTKTHVFYKIRIPTSSFGSRQIHPVWYPGDPDTSIKVLPKEIVTRLSKETGFERPELDAFWEQWTFMANTEWREDPDDLCLAMDRKTFNQCLVPPYGSRRAGPNLIYDRMFAFYDSNKDDLISFPEFLNGLAYRRKKNKLRKVYEGYDINGDGFVDRKDFLRIFRSYYALYKQMDREILESLDDQLINNTEAHQLVTGRQPLSGSFGREGRFPSAPDPRFCEGKAPGIDGDLEIADGKGVICDNSNDFGNKEDVIHDAAIREFQHRELDSLRSWDPTESNTYWLAMSNPPTSLTELQHDVLDGLIRNRRQQLAESGNSRPRLASAETGSFQSTTSTDGAMGDRTWAPNIVTVEDAAAVCGQGTLIGDVPQSSRPAVIDHAKRRLEELKLFKQDSSARQELHERWKRRQFYTDEEEGAAPPGDWKEEEDLPTINGKATENPKEPMLSSRPISPRSRSSSKVRFAEDTDDFEIRSNTSTTSRSVPERWGGMEIPDAEKDIGKEILYQVTQQAFNELLDPLFKKQEDLAVESLSTLESRVLYRALFTDPQFEGWACEVDRVLKKSRKRRPEALTDSTKENQREWRREQNISEVGLEEVRQRPLSQLLATSGYTLDTEIESFHDQLPAADESPSNEQAHNHGNLRFRSGNEPIPGILTGELNDTESLRRVVSFQEEVMRRLLRRPDPNITGVRDIPVQHSHEGYSDSSPPAPRSPPQQADMTFPQFRPNSISVDTAAADPLPLLSSPHEIRSLDRNNSGPEVPNIERTSHTLQDIGIPTNGTTQSEDPQNPVPEPEPTTATGDLDSPQLYFNRGCEAANRLPDAFLRANDSMDQYERSGSASFSDPNKTSPDLYLPDTIPIPMQENLCKLRDETLNSMLVDLQDQFKHVDWMMLYHFRELDAVEKQAKERGGWGRLNYEEFESTLKGGEGKSTRNMANEREREKKRALMDYLGSWIELCIP